MVGSFTKYPKFAGRGNEDVERYWYLYEVIWRARQKPDNVKVIELQNTLREIALRWFIKWVELNLNPNMDDIKNIFIQ